VYQAWLSWSQRAASAGGGERVEPDQQLAGIGRPGSAPAGTIAAARPGRARR